MSEHKFELGDTIKDAVTGFKGPAVARTMWIYGCVRYALEPSLDKDGKPQEEVWFDEQRLELVKSNKVPSSKTGGPRRDPSSRRRV